MLTVACVLRSGGFYTPEWVWALKRGVGRHLASPWRFRVLSDLECFGQDGVRLQMPWARWWSKMELFAPDRLEGPVLYLDLDTLVVGDLAELASWSGSLALLTDLYAPDRSQTGVMLFTPGPDTVRIWATFLKAPQEHMQRYKGDGEFVFALTRRWGLPRIQNLFPGQIVSYKAHARTGPPKGARLVCFHGQPKFDTLPAHSWAVREWTRRTLPEEQLP